MAKKIPELSGQEPQDSNPLNDEEIKQKQDGSVRVEPDLESDSFSEDEQKKIVQTVLDYAQLGKAASAEWVENRKRDLQHIQGEKPSIIEGYTKKAWQSDRNLNMCNAICDMYQATLLATCYNPETIHYKATEQNDVDNKDNLEKFTKWALGPSEANFFPEVDDFINNRICFGFSLFKIFWEVKYEWVDIQVPKISKETGKIIGYTRKTEKRRFERGVIKNIADTSDILIPNYGQSIQDVKFLIEKLHLHLDDLEDFEERKIILKHDQPIRKKFHSMLNSGSDSLKSEEAQSLGLNEFVGQDESTLGSMPVDIYEAYFHYKKDGKYERFRFWIEPITETFFSGKPLRKINRSGKLPYAGGPLRKRPGFIRGGSLPSLIADPINALNNTYNQTSDYQYVQNMPFGFANFSEGFTQSVYEIVPGEIYNVEGDPQKTAYFPNLQRNLAWSQDDRAFLMEVIEKLTGAASYFLTSESKGATLGRDKIVEEKGQTKFGLWVRRIQSDIADAINQFKDLYQEWAPPKLGQRVLGEDGKQLIKRQSLNSLRGNYDVILSPDITSGSKSFEREMKLWGLQVLGQSIWFQPQLNPRGSWLLTKEAMIGAGYLDPEHYLPPQPKEVIGTGKDVEDEFSRFMQGEDFEPPEGATPLVEEHLMGHVRQKQERYNDLDEEYRPIFDKHLFKTWVNYREYLKQVQIEQAAMNIAASAIDKLKQVGAGGSTATGTIANQPLSKQPVSASVPPVSPVPPAPPIAPRVPSKPGVNLG